MKYAVAFGLMLAVARVWLGFNVEPDTFTWVQAYKDTTHLFMGGLAVALWVYDHLWQWRLFWGLCILEVAVAVLSRV